MPDTPPAYTGTEIAVLAVAGRFPGAATLGAFWRNVRDGVESVHVFTTEELLAAGEDPALLSDPAYVRASPRLDGIELFDAGFFGISPRDASVMDPQHRLFLEVAWEAMERAGYSGAVAPLATGVFAATGMNHYMLHHVVPNAEIMRTVGEWLARHNGNDMNFMATRAAYQLNLRGPAMNVQSACSSSLTALHMACQSLLNRETDLALVGASTISMPQDRGYLHKSGEILSADGHCRPFDAQATGTLFGSGVGCAVLKRLDDAQRDGDTIVAVIRGTAINNDGAHKAGYLAPSVDGQARVIAEALGVAGVRADSIGLIEAHGTGTEIGDPIEVAALTQVFAPLVPASASIALGSVKANIGHLGEAAGMAGVIKTVLALQHGELPPCANYTAPNPRIDFAIGPFHVNTTLIPWPRTNTPRRAGVTALGVGGTNAHVILEEAPALDAGDAPARTPQLLTLSARTPTALATAAGQLADAIASDDALDLADAAWTLHEGRTAFACRQSIVARDAASAVAVLREAQAAMHGTTASETAQVVYLLPGGGAQYAAMGRELYETERAYRAAFDACLAEMPSALAQSLRQQMRPASDTAKPHDAFEDPRTALPALFATEYATARLLDAWGVTPAGLIGHSMGEYVAACLSGVFTLRDAIFLVTERARLFSTLPPGAMLSVELPEAELLPLLGDTLSIAAVNAPSLCVASGPVDSIDALEQELRARDVSTSRIHIAVAAHSAMLDPILDEFRAACARVTFAAPQVPFISNLTGTWITATDAMDPEYWVRHLRHTVRFGDGLQSALSGAHTVLLEVGPGRTLCNIARAHSAATIALPTMRHARAEEASDVEMLLGTVGQLWEHGVGVRLAALHRGTRRRRIPLPTYPFERQRYWLDAGVRRESDSPRADAVVRVPELRDWFSMPSWHRSALTGTVAAEHDGRWLVFADRGGVGEALAQQRPAGQTVLVTTGERFERRSASRYVVRARSGDDVAALFEALHLDGHWPQQVVFLPALDEVEPTLLGRLRRPDAAAEVVRAFDEHVVTLMAVAKAVAAQESALTLSTVARGLFTCTETDTPPDPMTAMLLGPTQVLPREASHVQSRCLDVALGDASPHDVAARLLQELRRPVRDTAVALRPAARWIRALQPVPLEPAAPGLPPIREGATVLITGGMGGLGLAIAKHLAATAKARLVLVSRTGMPDRGEWATIAERGGGDRIVAQARALLAIEAAGGSVTVVAADVTDREQMAWAASIARQQYGAIHGVIHAAGTIDDGLMALTAPSNALPVIAVKALGALVLDDVLRSDPIECFIAFSSISSVLGLEGQAAYTAANAFLDAFVERKRAAGFPRAISIGWNAWRDVGMTATIAEFGGQPALRVAEHTGPHPDLDRVTVGPDGSRGYSTVFSRSRHWMLGDHTVRDGESLLPGTAYLELVRAAHPRPAAGDVTVLRDVTFLAPFLVAPAAPRRLDLRLAARVARHSEFAFVPDDGDEPSVVGTVAHERAAPEPTEPLSSLRQRCGRSQSIDGFIDQPFMAFGPRWGVVTGIAAQGIEALVDLRLPDEFHADLATYALHPALLDMATGGAQRLIPGFNQRADFYVPFRYDLVRHFGALTPTLCSHVRYVAGRSGRDTACFDIDLFDADGTVVVQIRGFTMKRVDAGALRRSPATATAPARPSSQARLRTLLATAISPSEGVEAFDRILASGLSGHILASSVDLPRWSAALEAERRAAGRPRDTGAPAAPAFARPHLRTAYVAPRTPLEESLRALWSELLGVETIGVFDDFFELGGQSLVAVRLFSRIRKQFRVDLPLSTLFEAPTIAQCAAIIAEETSQHEAPALAAGVASGSRDEGVSGGGADVSANVRSARWRSLVVMQPHGDRPAFVCVAGMGGTLTNLRALAALLGDRRPVYGLQPPGAANPEELITCVVALASHYIEHLRREQPHGPYFLGGYSGGGTTAFEMARQLVAAGEDVAFLGFIDSFSPALPQRTFAERAALHARRAAAAGPGYLFDTMRRRLDAERGALRLRMARHLGRVLPDAYRYDAVQDSWLVAESRYRPEPLEMRATLLRAREESALSLWSGVRVDGEHGWGRYLRGGVDVQVCPGNHTTICEEPNVRVLASRLRAAIDAADPTLRGASPHAAATH